MNLLRTRTSRLAVALAALIGGGALLLTNVATAQDAAPAPLPPPTGKVFPTPEEATKALVEACEKNDDAALKVLFGPDSDDVLQSGTDPIVANERKVFAASAKEKTSFDRSGEAAGTLVVQVGAKDFPLPIPLRKVGDGWAFDAAAGREEMINRRVGQNEYETIALCRAYVAAQVAYAAKDRDGDEVREFAQKLRSTPGQQDGLYWSADAGEEESPLADIAAPLRDVTTDRKAPFNGYYFKILGEQSARAAGGAYSYVINGNMLAGFALVAVPAEYGSTGVKSFMVSHHGKIYEKDLGEAGLQQGMAMRAFDPDPSWTLVTPEEEAKAIRFWED